MEPKQYEFETVGDLLTFLNKRDPKQGICNSFGEALRVATDLEFYNGDIVFEPEETL